MYRILDHGAVILFVPHRRATSTLAYALDEARVSNLGVLVE